MNSPDEVALVKFCETVDVHLTDRDFRSIHVRDPNGKTHSFDILKEFPFSSARKRMGIIVRNRSNGVITFYVKGADVIMKKLLKFSDWLSEECDNLAREVAIPVSLESGFRFGAFACSLHVVCLLRLSIAILWHVFATGSSYFSLWQTCAKRA